ncbi:hypothetical protein RJT34_32836 [Clitoria ternatea]|uniref:Uncharacterized protein n=1 Tax=Clitoria ternatea TaxID=43366 RepID=A0AAN9EYU5_CLITE
MCQRKSFLSIAKTNLVFRILFFSISSLSLSFHKEEKKERDREAENQQNKTHNSPNHLSSLFTHSHFPVLSRNFSLYSPFSLRISSFLNHPPTSKLPFSSNNFAFRG